LRNWKFYPCEFIHGNDFRKFIKYRGKVKFLAESRQITLL